jgi:DNA repair protein RecO (recombination protein O)
MQHEAIDGVVIRVRPTGEHDVLLTILTAELGRITVLAKGSKSLKSDQRAISQLFTHANFEIYRRGELYILKGGAPLHPFYGISSDVVRFSLASYLCDVTYELTDEGEPAVEMQRLLLNALYSISIDRHPQEIVKGAFEFRAAFLSGYAPDLSGCTDCKTGEAVDLYLDVMNGALLCASCLSARATTPKRVGTYDEIREAELLLPLTPEVLAALRYAMGAPLERVFSFGLADREAVTAFESCAERYLLSHLGHGFETLEFYRTMRDDDTKGTKV